MASQCISYALGHPREIGVSARGNSRENGFGGLSKNNNNDQRVVHTKISIVGDGPIDIHRRVVHT